MSGGSSETEVNEFAVMPCTRRGAVSTVTAVSPMAKWARALLKSNDVSGAEDMGFPEDNTGGVPPAKCDSLACVKIKRSGQHRAAPFRMRKYCRYREGGRSFLSLFSLFSFCGGLFFFFSFLFFFFFFFFCFFFCCVGVCFLSGVSVFFFVVFVGFSGVVGAKNSAKPKKKKQKPEEEKQA